LVREGKLKRYLIYAIGEILLVMIGILLAMQVNNWNQNRINHKKEVKALSDLKNEFELNKQRIQAKQALRIGSTSGSIPNPSQKWTDWNQQKLEEASSNLISNTQYRNNLTGFDGCNRIVISECESVIRVLSKISNILDQEIEKCR